MIERILGILKAKNLSPAQFADMINVQRSSISHLISGRNKPSLEFIQKILYVFPEIDTDWLLFGKGEMIESGSPGNQNLPAVPIADLFTPELPRQEKVVETKKTDIEKAAKKKQADMDGRKIEKIVWFYKDNTFREFYPESF